MTPGLVARPAPAPRTVRLVNAMNRAEYTAPIVEEALASWDAIEAEHDTEHFDDIVLDCPICVAEWKKLTG